MQSGLKADGIGQHSETDIDNKWVNTPSFRVCKTFMRRFDPDPRLQYMQYISIVISKLTKKFRSFWFVLNRAESA
jgi:hypothetical protein